MSVSAHSNVKIVLVEPSHPGNIGAVARALKTMGLSRLCLVAPKLYPNAEATARASGADDVLHAAEVVASYEEALRGCQLVMGTSARPRTIAWPELEPRTCAEKLVEAAARGPVALVFGREHSGLTNAELDHCHYLVRISANPAYSSLNLAAAVQVLAYEIRRAVEGRGRAVVVSEGEKVPATAEETEGFFWHLEKVLTMTGFLTPAQPKQLMRRLRRLFNRAQPDRTEINILRGLLKSVERSISEGKPGPPAGD